MEEIGSSLKFQARGFMRDRDVVKPFVHIIDGIDRWFDENDERDMFEFLERDSFFASRISMQMDLEHPRPTDLTNSSGVAVDPVYVIQKIEDAIVNINPAMFGRIVLPQRIKTQLFEQRTSLRENMEESRGIQAENFGFTVDFSDEKKTFFALVEWVTTEDPEIGLSAALPDVQIDDRPVYDIYVSLLVIAYLYYNGLYKRNGITALQDFWTSYSPKRRQGSRIPRIDDINWTIRHVARLAEKIEETEEEEELAIDIHGVIPHRQPISVSRDPPVRDTTLDVRRLIVKAKNLFAMQLEFRNLRTIWQSDPIGSEFGPRSLEREKMKIVRENEMLNIDMKRLGVIKGSPDRKRSTYSEDPLARTLISWHQIVTAEFANVFYSGIATWDATIPLLYPERNRDAEYNAMSETFYN